MKYVLPVLAAALIAAAGTGCGGDDGGDAAGTTGATTAATTDATQTRPEPASDQSRWARQVDAACKPWQEKIDEIAATPPVDAAGLERFIADILPPARSQLAAVEAVKPPADEEEAEQATSFVRALGKLERALTRYLAALRADNGDAATAALAEANSAGAEARSLALALGVTECGGFSGT